ncbi:MULTISPECIES: hypothetical protein [unclassified Streptomyces]|uniref:hypothetical protein n=1 Tax=Streptomyces sp. NPDC127129 TaxID=3345373 RepID=UPI00363DB03E
MRNRRGEGIRESRNLVSRGRAAGVVTFCATQKPGSDVVDTSLRDLLSIRWALRCTTPEASDTILGKGAAASGYSAKTIQSEIRGAGHLWAEGTNPVMVRADYYTDEQVNTLLERATKWRRKAGTLPAGPLTLAEQLRAQDDEDARSLANVLDIFTAHATDTGPAQWLPGQLLVDELKAASHPVTAEKLGALIQRTDDDKVKRPWGPNKSRLAGYPLARVEATTTDLFGLTA